MGLLWELEVSTDCHLHPDRDRPQDTDPTDLDFPTSNLLPFVLWFCCALPYIKCVNGEVVSQAGASFIDGWAPFVRSTVSGLAAPPTTENGNRPIGH